MIYVIKSELGYYLRNFRSKENCFGPIEHAKCFDSPKDAHARVQRILNQAEYNDLELEVHIAEINVQKLLSVWKRNGSNT